MQKLTSVLSNGEMQDRQEVYGVDVYILHMYVDILRLM